MSLLHRLAAATVGLGLAAALFLWLTPDPPPDIGRPLASPSRANPKPKPTIPDVPPPFPREEDKAPVPPDEATTRLKIFGVGVANAREARGARPAKPRSRLPLERQASWIIPILPYIGRGDLFDAIHSAATDGDDRPWDDPANRDAVGELVAPLVTPEMDAKGELRDPSGAALTGYVGVSGTGPASPKLPEESRDPTRGFFGYRRVAKPAEVQDGLANTAMVMEVRSRRGPWAQNGPSTVRPIEAFEGGLVLMADGSVQNLASKPDPKVARALSTIAAGD